MNEYIKGCLIGWAIGLWVGTIMTTIVVDLLNKGN